jgi:catechol 2,3-dioxygenase-like lactoylglutathione lyase family enzyme
MAPPQPNQPNKEATYVADPGTRIGHVHLKAADLERSIRFYSGVPGLQIMQRLGDSPAFSLRRWLRPSHRAEHAGEPGWPSTAAGRDRALSLRYRLSHTCGAGRRVA